MIGNNLSTKEQKMSLDKFKEHIAEEDKSEEVVAEEAKTDEDFDAVVEAEEQTTEVAEAKKETVSEAEEGDDEEEDEVAESKHSEEEDEEEVTEEADEDEEEEMDETADMTKTELQASAMKMIKSMKKDDLVAGYKAMRASYDPAKKEVGINTPEETKKVSEDVEVMFAGSDLSEDFKAKAQTIFEAAVTAKASEAINEVEVAKEAAIKEGVDAVKEELTEKVDSYLDYVVEQWMKDNEIAIEKGLKAELVEDFLGGLKNLFMEHYIDVPEEKVDVLEEQSTEIEELKSKLAEQIEANVASKKILDQFAAQEVLSQVSEGLVDTEAEKIAKLAEGVEFVDTDQYREKLETIKESYFPKVKATGGNPEDNVSEVSIETTDAMAAYAQALSRMKKG